MFVYLLVFVKENKTDLPTVTKEDVDTLKDDWLTDNVSSSGISGVHTRLIYTLRRQFPSGKSKAYIHLIADSAKPTRYLEREHLSRYPTSHIILLRPSMAFMLMKTPNPLTLKDALPDFSRTTHIFLPINDAHNVSVAEGGSHWSLLLVSIIDGVAFHYDSLSASNWDSANNATGKLSMLLGRPLRFMNLEDSPQQENGSDCGVYVCIQMRHLLLKRLLSANSKEKISMSMGGKQVDANGGRKEMLRTIETFRKEGERRRS